MATLDGGTVIITLEPMFTVVAKNVFQGFDPSNPSELTPPVGTILLTEGDFVLTEDNFVLVETI